MNTAEVLNFHREEKPRVKADLDDGYTQVANTLLVQLARYDFSKRQYKVLLAIMEKTYRYHQASADIELDDLCEATGLKPSPVSHTTNELAALRIIFKRRAKKGFNYEINPVISEWLDPSDLMNKTCMELMNETCIDAQNVHASCTKHALNVNETCMTPINKNIKNNIKNTSRPDSCESEHGKQKKSSQKVHFDSEDLRLAEWMFEQVLNLNPDHKPVKLEKWANTIRLMRDRDGKGHRQIAELFKWCNRDSFWHKNILCPDTLRAKWDELVIKSGGVGRVNYSTQDFPEEQKPLVDAYKRHCPPKYPAPAAWSPKRGAMITAILESGHIKDDEWDEFWAWVAQQDIPGAIGFDWFINMDNFLKVFEGTYRAVRGQ